MGMKRIRSAAAAASAIRTADDPRGGVASGNVRGLVTPCHVGWFVDRHRMDLRSGIDPVTDGLGTMQLDAIDAIEVYRGMSEMPPEFAEPDLRCGAVSICTRRG